MGAYSTVCDVKYYGNPFNLTQAAHVSDRGVILASLTADIVKRNPGFPGSFISTATCRLQYFQGRHIAPAYSSGWHLLPPHAARRCGVVRARTYRSSAARSR